MDGEVIETPRDAALALIRPYARGEYTEAWLRSTYLRREAADWGAQIGGCVRSFSHPPTRVVVYRVRGVYLDPPAVFSLHDIYETARRESGAYRPGEQMSLLTEEVPA